MIIKRTPERHETVIHQRDTVTVVNEVEKPAAGRRKLSPLIAVPAIALVAYVLIRKMLKMAVS